MGAPSPSWTGIQAPCFAWSCLANSASVLPEELARDDLALDLGRTFVDARTSYLAIQMLQEVTALEGTGATHLDGDVDSELRGLGGEELRHCGEGTDRPDAGVMRGGRRMHEHPRGLDARGHRGELMGEALKSRQRLTERGALRSVRNGGVERRLCDADRARADARAVEIQGAHRDSEPTIDITKNVAGRNEHSVEYEPADGMIRHQRSGVA